MQNSSKLPQVPRKNFGVFKSTVLKILHLDVDYTFHSDVLHVKGDHEFLLHTEPKLKQNHSSDIQSNSSQVMVTYLRQGVRPELNKTSELKMKWHWVTKDGKFSIFYKVSKTFQNVPVELLPSRQKQPNGMPSTPHVILKITVTM